MRSEVYQPQLFPTDKRCSGCGALKPRTEFSRRLRAHDGLYEYCKPCCSKRGRVRRLAKPEEKSRQDKAYREKNKERLAAQKHQQYLDDPERAKSRAKAWVEANRQRVSVHKKNYKARKRSAEGRYTVEDIALIRRSQRDRCLYCNCMLGGDEHIDHLIPLSRGGTNWPENLALSCGYCNMSKRDKTPDEYRAWLATVKRGEHDDEIKPPGGVADVKA